MSETIVQEVVTRSFATELTEAKKAYSISISKLEPHVDDLIASAFVGESGDEIGERCVHLAKFLLDVISHTYHIQQKMKLIQKLSQVFEKLDNITINSVQVYTSLFLYHGDLLRERGLYAEAKKKYRKFAHGLDPAPKKVILAKRMISIKEYASARICLASARDGLRHDYDPKTHRCYCTQIAEAWADLVKHSHSPRDLASTLFAFVFIHLPYGLIKKEDKYRF